MKALQFDLPLILRLKYVSSVQPTTLILLILSVYKKLIANNVAIETITIHHVRNKQLPQYF